MSNFLRDLKTGQKAEDSFKDYLEQQGYKVEKNTSKSRKELKEYDLLVNDKTKVEIKLDLKAPKTGNIAIEFQCNNKPSGLTSSKSPIWVYIIDNIFYIFKKQDLDTLFEEKKYKRVVSGGDGNRAKLALFDFNFLKKFAKIIG